MKFIVFIAIMVALATRTAGQLTCNTCSWTSGSTNNECFNGEAITRDFFRRAGISTQSSCPPAADLDPYCQTKMTIDDGIVVKIDRGCAVGASDFDQSTLSMPPKDKCITQISTGTSDVEKSECYFSCNAKNCNTVKPDTLKLCSVNCGSYGRCDYISGTCVCRSGYSGANCSTEPTAPETFMSCVQCSQETDPTCPDMTSGTPCSSASHKYCSTTMVTTFDEKGVKVRSSVTKACSESYVASDECFISKRSDYSYPTDVEYTCVTTCDVNNCITKIPDGLITGNEVKQPIRCIQCSSSDVTSACSAGDVEATEVCPSRATHCKSVASYYFSERSDATYQAEPDYQMINITRSCSNSEVTRDCSSVKVGSSSLKVVTCQETCQTDRCNDGWPSRPKCAQCNGRNCAIRPFQPTQCPHPYQRYCILQETNKAIDPSNIADHFILFGYRSTAIRDCSYHDIGNKCVTNSYGDGKSENCNKTCETDGCNLGSSAETLTASILLTVLGITLGNVFSS